MNAVYALMAGSTALGGSSVALRIGSTEIASPSATSQAGSGYVKESFSGGGLPELSEDAVLSQEGEGLAWGAVYAQYLEDMGRVPSLRAEGFAVEKKLFVERAQEGDTEWEFYDGWIKFNENIDKVSANRRMEVEGNYYYRVRSTHSAGNDMSSSFTNGVFIEEPQILPGIPEIG